ncbi:14630_t:CDS:2 [Rhizophagus irregularis]|nr:14630_t:CDS:2 [Rhizophagus irregularis]
MGMDAEYFNQAEEIRLELIKSKMLGPDFNEKPHPKAIYTSRSITFNTKPKYITKEYEFDINEI